MQLSSSIDEIQAEMLPGWLMIDFQSEVRGVLRVKMVFTEVTGQTQGNQNPLDRGLLWPVVTYLCGLFQNFT